MSGGLTLVQGRLATVLRGLTLAASLVALLYVARVLAANWDSTRAAGSRSFAVGLAMSFAAITSSLLLLAGTWHWLLRQLGVEVGRLAALHAWFTGNLHKYIPGQVWMAVGRTAKGAQVGVPARATLGTTAIEQVFSVLAAGLVLGVAQGWLILAVPSALATAGLLHPRVANAALDIVGRIGRRPLPLVPLRGSQLAVLYLVSLAVVALGVLAMAGILLGLGIFRLSELRTYVVACTGSFLSGYLFFGAPAGLGVREGALLVLLGRAGISAGDASFVAVASRAVTVVAELACFFAVSALARARSSRPSTDP